MKLTFTIDGDKQTIQRTDNNGVVSDSVKFLTAEFLITGMIGMVTTPIFTQADKSPTVEFQQTGTDTITVACLVPPSIISYPDFDVSLFGYNATTGARITVPSEKISVSKSGYRNGTGIDAPSKTVYEQLLDAIANVTVSDEKIATAAHTSETNAKTSETNAANSATSAATSESNAATSANTATAKASNASTSATAAANSATAAHTSETNAASSATSASTSASTATTKASQASTSATNAANSATAASNSSSSASTYATSALAYDTESKSYAVGGTGSRTGEDIDNSKYYAEQARIVSGTNAWIDFDANGYLTLYTKED